LDQANLAFFSTSPSAIEPTSLIDTWNHPDPKNRELGEIKLRDTAYFELDWFPAVIVKFLESILMRVLLLSSMM
jgi:hypothetical protein